MRGAATLRRHIITSPRPDPQEEEQSNHLQANHLLHLGDIIITAVEEEEGRPEQQGIILTVPVPVVVVVALVPLVLASRRLALRRSGTSTQYMTMRGIQSVCHFKPVCRKATRASGLLLG